jgi:acetoin utilization deacetylase AcuC-like enzyme
LPPGSGVGAHEAVFDRVVVPALRRFKPEFIIVPSGFDAGAHDPLGRQMMTSEGYRHLTRKLMAVADEVCEGRLVMCHEAGPATASGRGDQGGGAFGGADQVGGIWKVDSGEPVH